MLQYTIWLMYIGTRMDQIHSHMTMDMHITEQETSYAIIMYAYTYIKHSWTTVYSDLSMLHMHVSLSGNPFINK